MSRLFTCGFEENNLSSTIFNSVGVGASIVDSGTRTPHSGTYSGQLSGSGGGKTMTRNIGTQIEGTHLYYRTYWRTTNIAVAESRVFRARSSTATNAWELFKTFASKFKLTNTPTAESVTGTYTIVVDTWYRIEVHHFLSNTAGTLEAKIYLGDSLTVTETLTMTFGGTADTLPSPDNVNEIILDENTNSTSLVYNFDDVAVNDGAGSFHNTWCGPGKIALIKPTANSSVAWTPNTGTNWEAVDDVPGAPDDITTYNGTTSTSAIDSFTLSDLPGEVTSSATMKVFDVYARVAAASASNTAMRMRAVDNASGVSNGTTFNVNGATWRILSAVEHLPVDLTGKTKANVNDYEAGYAGQSTGTVERRVSALWANVEWIEVTGQTLAVDSGIYTSTGQVALLRQASPLYLRYRK